MRGVCRAAQGMDGPPRRHDRRRVEEADESIHLAVGLREQQLAFGLPLDVRRHLRRMQEARQRGQHLRRRTRRADEGSERPMTPASPAETAATPKSTPRPWHINRDPGNYHDTIDGPDSDG